MTFFLGGWHFLKWVKRWLTLEISSSLLLSCTNIVVITWIHECELFSTIHRKKLLTAQFGGWHIDCYKTYILFKYWRVVLLECINSLKVLFGLICISLYKTKSHWLYILGDWYLDKLVKRWFTRNYIVNHLSGNLYILYVQDAATFILNFVSKTALCTTKWLTYNQYKKVH